MTQKQWFAPKRSIGREAALFPSSFKLTSKRLDAKKSLEECECERWRLRGQLDFYLLSFHQWIINFSVIITLHVCTHSFTNSSNLSFHQRNMRSILRMWEALCNFLLTIHGRRKVFVMERSDFFVYFAVPLVKHSHTFDHHQDACINSTFIVTDNWNVQAWNGKFITSFNQFAMI